MCRQKIHNKANYHIVLIKKQLLMDYLSQVKLFRLLSETSQKITNQKMHNAYGKFIAHIDTISSGNDFISIIRKLNITRIELVFLLKQNQYEQEKKCS